MTFAASRVLRFPATVSSQHALEHLWPSMISTFQNKINAMPNAKLLEQSLLVDEDVAKTATQNKNGQEWVGAMTKRINHFLTHQIKTTTTKNSSEAVYTPDTLDLYDALVWDFNSPFHWRIQPKDIEALYRYGLAGSERHCEVAVGTGLFLRRWAQEITEDNERERPLLEHITLMDLSPSSLDECYNRLQQVELYQEAKQMVAIDQVQANIMEPTPQDKLRGTFDSVAANFLLHCLHGENMEDKRQAIQSCADLLQPDGIFFGSTVLGKELEGDSANAGPYALETNRLYNELGIFGNQGDTFSDLDDILGDTFHSVHAWNVGYCALWFARNPKR